MIHDKHKAWIEARGLDPKLAEALGLETIRDKEGYWLALPYREGGEVINHKYRQTSEKRHRMDAGAPLALWNADCLSDPKVLAGAPVIVTEGEWDAMAALQAGFPFAVSVPNGAPQKPTADLETAKRYEWIDRHAHQLREVKQFILATDNDQPGWQLRTELVALLGAERCRFVDYPAGCKDLNEVLLEHGAEKLVELVTTAKPIPVKGLYRPSDFPEKGQVQAYTTGIEPLGDMLWIVPGTLTVFTGYSNMGKSTLMNAIIAHCIGNHFPVCVASFETEVKPILIEGIASNLLQCHKDAMTRQPDYPEAMRLIESSLTIISQAVDEDLEMDLDEFLRLARLAVVQHGAKMVIIDPWNELEHKRRRDESETEYIGRAIRALKRFAKQNDVALWIVAHPSKPEKGVMKIPGLYDISGSAHWANKADYGLVYHRPSKDNLATIRVVKVRMGLPGNKDEVQVSYDFRNSRFVLA